MGGFFYDVELPGGRALTNEDLKSIENKMKEIVKRKDTFDRKEVTLEKAIEIFQGNRFKQDVLARLPSNQAITLYRSGGLIDLCRGPHLPSTSLIKAISLLRLSAVHYRADSGDMLQRVHGISFEKASVLKEWEILQEES